MRNHRRQVTGLRHSLAALLVGAGVYAGCALPQRRDPAISDESTKALLAAADAHQITLFGEIDRGREPAYFTRTAVSLRQHTFAEVGEDLDVDLDADGRRMVFASTRHNRRPDLYIKAVDGVAVTQLTADPASDVEPALSPDGTRVAFASNRAGNWDIWIIAVTGGPPTQVTSGAADEIHPSWSPDGSQLVYCSLSAAGGQWELWLTDAGVGFTKRFLGYGLFPEWSPVADTIVYQRDRERGRRWFSIWTITLVDAEPRYPTEIAASAAHAMILPSWSPDGTQIAFATTADVVNPPVGLSGATVTGVFDIWVMNADGRSKVRLTDGHTANYAPNFSPSGRVFFTSNRLGQENIWSLLPGASTAPSSVTAVTAGAKASEADPAQTAQTALVRDDN